MLASSALRPRRSVCLLVLAWGVLGTARAASAEPAESDLVLARQAFAEGLRLEEFRDFVGALEQFERVAAVKATPQVRFHRALCLEKLGRWTDARDEFKRARDAAQGDDPQLSLVRLNATQHITQLDARMPSLTLTLSPATARVMIDARVLPQLAGARPIALDPGPHLLRVTATGHHELLERFDVTAGSRLTGRAILRPMPRGASPGKASWSVAPVYVSGGIAVASLVASAVFLGLRASTLAELDQQCGAGRAECPPSARDLDARGRTFTTLGNVFLGVGISATAVGIGSWFFGSRASGASEREGPPSRLVLGPAEGG